MKIIIRNLEPEDFFETISTIHRAYRISLGKIYPKRLINLFCKKYTEDSLKERSFTTKHFIAENQEDNKICGIIGLKGNQLRTFFVDPEYQGKGVGRMLYDKLENFAREKGLKEIRLEGSPLGEPVYRSLGFSKVKTKNKKRGGISYSDAVMIKKLQ